MEQNFLTGNYQNKLNFFKDHLDFLYFGEKKKQYFEGTELEKINQLILRVNQGQWGNQEKKEAFTFMKKVVKLHDDETVEKLGFYYLNGAIEKNYSKAAKYLLSAAMRGNVQASEKLNEAFNASCPIEQKIPFLKAYSTLMYKLGGDYYLGKNGCAINYTRAFNFFQRAAELGEPNSNFFLALSYWEGHGTLQDYEKAFSLLKKVAKGNTYWVDKGKALLGNFYLRGIGTQQSDMQAAHYFSQVATPANESYISLLARFYEEGRGVPKDEAKNIELLKKAAENGSSEAKVRLIQKGYVEQLDL